MIDVNKREIHRYILELIDEGLGANLSSIQLASTLVLWEQGKVLSYENCSKEIMEVLNDLTNKIIEYKVDNDYMLNSVSWALKNAETIKYNVAKEELIEYELNDTLKFFLESLLKRKG